MSDKPLTERLNPGGHILPTGGHRLPDPDAAENRMRAMEARLAAAEARLLRLEWPNTTGDHVQRVTFDSSAGHPDSIGIDDPPGHFLGRPTRTPNTWPLCPRCEALPLGHEGECEPSNS